jgi:hypothetical protein
MCAICCCGVTLALAESLNRDGKFPANKAAQAGLSPGRVVVAPSARPAEDRYRETGFSNVRFAGNTDISGLLPDAGCCLLHSSRFLVAIFIFDGEQSQGVRHRLTLVRAEPPRLQGSLTSSLGSVDAPSGDGVFRVGRIL